MVQSLSCIWFFATPWTAACQASLSFTISQSLLKLMSIESMMPSNHLILCHPVLLLSSILPIIRVFFNELVLCIRRPKYCSFSFSISPSDEYSGLISFRIDWFDLLTAQEILKSLLYHHTYHSFFLTSWNTKRCEVNMFWLPPDKDRTLTSQPQNPIDMDFVASSFSGSFLKFLYHLASWH